MNSIKKCKNANRYKGIREPKCNGGNPCDFCKKKYHSMLFQRALKNQIMVDIRNDNGMIVKSFIKEGNDTVK